jgi:hypothetical protein
MTIVTVIAAIVFAICIAAAVVLWAGGIANEPPPTEAEKRVGFGFVADVVEDDGEYHD